jgi:hypothetical protein
MFPQCSLNGQVLQQLSQARNRIPLKPIEGRSGLRLPPEEFTLTTPGWQVSDGCDINVSHRLPCE